MLEALSSVVHHHGAAHAYRHARGRDSRSPRRPMRTQDHRMRASSPRRPTRRSRPHSRNCARTRRVLSPSHSSRAQARIGPSITPRLSRLQRPNAPSLENSSCRFALHLRRHHHSAVTGRRCAPNAAPAVRATARAPHYEGPHWYHTCDRCHQRPVAGRTCCGPLLRHQLARLPPPGPPPSALRPPHPAPARIRRPLASKHSSPPPAVAPATPTLGGNGAPHLRNATSAAPSYEFAAAPGDRRSLQRVPSSPKRAGE